MSDNQDAGGVELADLGEDIAFLTRTLRAHLRAEVNALRAELGIEPGEIGVLRLIGLNPGISQNQLADVVVIKKSAVTKIVGELVGKGLITREQSRTDRRYNALTLTPRGEEQVARVKVRVDALYGELFTGFSAEEKAALFAGLRKLIGNLSDRRLERDTGEAD